MTDEEREKLVKECRIASLNDFQRMLGKFLDAHPGPSNEIKQIAGELLNIASRHVQELTEEKTEIKLRKAKGSD